MSMLIKSLYMYGASIFLKPSPLILSDFFQQTVIMDDKWNKKTDGDVQIEFYTDIDKINKIGFISYRVKVGQVGLFRLDEEYRNRGLGKQILTQVIEDMKNHGTTEIWAVTTENHPFWSNVYNKSFSWYEYKQLHPSVTGSGYKMKI